MKSILILSVFFVTTVLSLRPPPVQEAPQVYAGRPVQAPVPAEVQVLEGRVIYAPPRPQEGIQHRPIQRK